mmetsp:Transcript_384/g.596  ORF Transcript_384/g.596 Transcript_384/m.596 type:complete len:377 (-) Transcript_384:217-1347(-)
MPFLIVALFLHSSHFELTQSESGRRLQLLRIAPELERTGWTLEEPMKHFSREVDRWTSPSGQTLHTFTTNTEPRFVFAYNPLDNDMARMAKTWVLEPALTLAWHDATRTCCRDGSGLVVDVGGNFGWYTLYSIALGCRVLVIEPVPAWLEILKLGVSLNPGFASRLEIAGNVVYPQAGNFTLRVPKPSGKRPMYLGMTYMKGSAGMIKGYSNGETYKHVASSIQIDDVVDSDLCLFKADVEGYEAQVFHTAQRLFTEHRVAAIQLEMTKSPKDKEQTCASIKMLEHLHSLGYKFKIAHHNAVDNVIMPPVGKWINSHVLDQLNDFPSLAAYRRAKRSGRSPMREAYDSDFVTFSTNLVGYRLNWTTVAAWPNLRCS